MHARSRGLHVVRRRDTGTLYIEGFIGGRRFRRRAQSNDRALAEEEAALIEAEVLRTRWHGERRGARSFAEAVLSYTEAAPRSPAMLVHLHKMLRVIGNETLASISQETVTKLRRVMLRPDPSPATVTRHVIVPLRAVMNHAHTLDWCDVPHFVVPKQPQGRTRYLLPAEAERLIEHAAPHLKPLLTFLLCTGVRMSEALELEWRDVDLAGGRAILWRTKNGRRRVGGLPSRAVVALAGRGNGERVFATAHGAPYADRARQGGGQIKTGWKAALRRAGLDPELTPHDLRHTWASWHYALHHDVLALKEAGGWSSVTLVERYAHLLPSGQEAAIRAFWGLTDERREMLA